MRHVLFALSLCLLALTALTALTQKGTQAKQEQQIREAGSRTEAKSKTANRKCKEKRPCQKKQSSSQLSLEPLRSKTEGMLKESKKMKDKTVTDKKSRVQQSEVVAKPVSEEDSLKIPPCQNCSEVEEQIKAEPETRTPCTKKEEKKIKKIEKSLKKKCKALTEAKCVSRAKKCKISGKKCKKAQTCKSCIQYWAGENQFGCLKFKGKAQPEQEKFPEKLIEQVIEETEKGDMKVKEDQSDPEEQTEERSDEMTPEVNKKDLLNDEL